MRTASRLVAEVLEGLRTLVGPGISTYDLEQFASAEALKSKSKCAFRGYHKYPSSLCCSPNNQVVHGLPNKKPLKTGDIISLDFGILHDGFYGDAAITVPVGVVSENAKRLMVATEESLYVAIEKAVPGNRLGDICFAVQSYVESRGYSVVRDFVGHGIGKSLHEDPQIPNY